MKLIQFSQARANLASVFDEVENDAEETVITRSGHESMVLLSLSEYEAMKETLYLLKGENGRVLHRRIAQMDAGRNVTKHELIDGDAEGLAEA
jgi:antitoxin YefM